MDYDFGMFFLQQCFNAHFALFPLPFLEVKRITQPLLKEVYHSGVVNIIGLIGTVGDSLQKSQIIPDHLHSCRVIELEGLAYRIVPSELAGGSLVDHSFILCTIFFKHCPF